MSILANIFNDVYDLFSKPKVVQVRPMNKINDYQFPKVIPPKYHKLFVKQAGLARVSPEQFGRIALREQGSYSTPKTIKLVGQKDRNDKGLMQVNRVNEPFIKKMFLKELGRPYDYRRSGDSIIAARMVLQNNRKQFNQMIKNGTFKGPYDNNDLIDTYNTGVTGFVRAKRGDIIAKKRLLDYQNAGL